MQYAHRALYTFLVKDNCAFTFYGQLVRQIQSNVLGMQVAAPKTFTIPDNRVGTYMAEIDKIIPKKPQLFMVVIPNNKVVGQANH